MVQVTVPASSGLPTTALLSPRVVLALYEGDCDEDEDAPEWTLLIPNRDMLFRQPRGAMAEVYARLALWDTENVCLFSFLFFCNIAHYITGRIILVNVAMGCGCHSEYIIV